MRLTSNAEIAFEEWYTNNYHADPNDYNFVPIQGKRDGQWNTHIEVTFYMLTAAQKFAVYIDFADSLSKRKDIICRLCILIIETQKGFAYTINGTRSDTFPTRPEARLAAINNLDTLLNQIFPLILS